MPPVKIDQAENLPEKGGVLAIADADGLIYVKTGDNIRGRAECLCRNKTPKNEIAWDIAFRRTGIQTVSAPHGTRTKKYLREHNGDVKAAIERAVGELSRADIRFVVEEDEDRRKLLKQFAEMHLSDMEWKEQNEWKGRHRKRLIGLAKN